MRDGPGSGDDGMTPNRSICGVCGRPLLSNEECPAAWSVGAVAMKREERAAGVFAQRRLRV